SAVTIRCRRRAPDLRDIGCECRCFCQDRHLLSLDTLSPHVVRTFQGLEVPLGGLQLALYVFEDPEAVRIKSIKLPLKLGNPYLWPCYLGLPMVFPCAGIGEGAYESRLYGCDAGWAEPFQHCPDHRVIDAPTAHGSTFRPTLPVVTVTPIGVAG